MSRRVLVTGVAGQIGGATAALLASQGWEVVGTDAKEPEDPSSLSEFRAVDLSDLDAVTAVTTDLAGDRLDGVVNNAATQPPNGALGADAAEWRQALDVNLVAPAMIVRAVAKVLGEGSAVVNVASVHAVATTAGRAAYSSSKAALVGLTRTLAMELAPKVRVNAVLPGAVDSPMLIDGLAAGGRRRADLESRIPLGRVAEAGEIAATIAFLLGPASSYMTGQSLVVDGGVLAQLSSE